MISTHTLEALVADMRRLGVRRVSWGEGSGEIELDTKALADSGTSALKEILDLDAGVKVSDPKLCSLCQTRPKGRIDPALCRECALQAAGVVL